MPDNTETLDSIKMRGVEVHVYQASSGYRFSLDALLLADFPDLRSPKHIIEIGAGSGVVSLLLAKLFPKSKVTGIEIQAGLHGRAVRNAELNGLSDRVIFLHADINDARRILKPGSFDLAVMNPPFRRPGTGKISPGDERAAARHELTATLSDMVAAASVMLRNRGRLCVVYHPSRLPELLCEMRARTLEPKRMRTIHSHEGDMARMALVEAVRQGNEGLKILPPLYVYESGKTYSAEMKAFYGL